MYFLPPKENKLILLHKHLTIRSHYTALLSINLIMRVIKTRLDTDEWKGSFAILNSLYFQNKHLSIQNTRMTANCTYCFQRCTKPLRFSNIHVSMYLADFVLFHTKSCFHSTGVSGISLWHHGDQQFSVFHVITLRLGFPSLT